MSKHLLMIAACLLLATGAAWSQEVVITGFPVGVGGSIDDGFFEPFYPDLQAMVDTLQKYPRSLLIVTGSADGNQYRANNDALNPSLALGRAHIVRNLLVSKLGADSSRVLIQSTNVTVTGPEYRYARVRLVQDREMADLENRLAAVENRPPVEKHFTEVREVPATVTASFADYLGVQFAGGATTSPFGGMPLVSGALSWKRMVYVEAVLGHTFWDNEFTYQGNELDTKRRMAGAQVIYFPLEEIPVGLVGGWMRIEEISERYYKYVRLSEGPVAGLRGTYKMFALTGLYNPSRQREAGVEDSEAHHDQFLVNLTAFFELGGMR